jgi:hypothetical protein
VGVLLSYIYKSYIYKRWEYYYLIFINGGNTTVCSVLFCHVAGPRHSRGLKKSDVVRGVLAFRATTDSESVSTSCCCRAASFTIPGIRPDHRSSCALTPFQPGMVMQYCNERQEQIKRTHKARRLGASSRANSQQL